MKAVKQVLRYVKGTKDYGITYKHNGGNIIQGFSDSSYGVNTQEGKRTTGIIFYYGDSPIRWSTQKQATITLSSCESEFIAAAATQALWLKRLLSRLTHSEEKKITIMVDNKSAIQLMKNLFFMEGASTLIQNTTSYENALKETTYKSNSICLSIHLSTRVKYLDVATSKTKKNCSYFVAYGAYKGVNLVSGQEITNDKLVMDPSITITSLPVNLTLEDVSNVFKIGGVSGKVARGYASQRIL
nr:ribonuclease H-like domain, reverse transcriptase, RNA-dependent DNA polymerase [Tanacetum cinerariifolium]